MSKQPKISDSEWMIMELLWENSYLSSKDIHQKLEETGWNIQTVKTFLARLVDKGIIDYNRDGRSFLYYPILSRDECTTFQSKSFLNKIFGGSLHIMVSNLIENDEVSQEELEELRKLLDERKG